MGTGLAETAIETFRGVEKTLPGADAPWLAALRRRAIESFERSGHPPVRDEDWRFTDISGFARRAFRAPTALRAAGPRAEDPFASVPRHELSFVDGRYAGGRVAGPALPAGVRVEPLAEALRRDGKTAESHLSAQVGVDRPFAALNTALFSDGALVTVPDGCIVGTPIHLLFHSTGAEGEMTHPRTLVVLGRSSEATVLETYVGGPATEGPRVTNAVTEVAVGPDAKLHHVRLVAEGASTFHAGTLRISGARASAVTSHSIAFGGALVRNEIHASLDGEGADLYLGGLFVPRGTQHVDHHTRIDHAAPHTSSREVYKGILADSARGVFHGRILVRPGAQKTDAKQTNKNVLLSKAALVDSTPQLEIYADDVKCTHGSTTGQMDEDAIFYLRSRGIDDETARGILSYAFGRDVLDRIRDEAVRTVLGAALLRRLPGGEALHAGGLA
ncbi:MAG: Fe-S cluster assembly protein SufD [Methanobacteriota archaeon]